MPRGATPKGCEREQVLIRTHVTLTFPRLHCRPNVCVRVTHHSATPLSSSSCSLTPPPPPVNPACPTPGKTATHHDDDMVDGGSRSVCGVDSCRTGDGDGHGSWRDRTISGIYLQSDKQVFFLVLYI